MSRAAWAFVGLLVAFGGGFGPQWWRAQKLEEKVAGLERQLELSRLHNQLGFAFFEAGRGDYEGARRTMAALFTAMQSHIFEIDDIGLRARFQSVLDQRDDTITSLSRSEPGSVARLEAMYQEIQAGLEGHGLNPAASGSSAPSSAALSAPPFRPPPAIAPSSPGAPPAPLFDGGADLLPAPSSTP